MIGFRALRRVSDLLVNKMVYNFTKNTVNVVQLDY